MARVDKGEVVVPSSSSAERINASNVDVNEVMTMSSVLRVHILKLSISARYTDRNYIL